MCPMQDARKVLNAAQAMIDTNYSTDEVDFGYASPKANLLGTYGLHVVVTTTYTDLQSGVNIWIVHGAAATSTTKHSAMFIPVASLDAGAHFFIPVGSIPLLRYSRAYFDAVSEDATLGNLTMWFGFGPDGAGS